MNGLAGVHHGDGPPAGPAEVRAMLAAIAHRGRGGGGGVRNDGPAALGALHGLASDGALTVVADARLDNRAELARALGIDPRPDAELILAAYRRWGEDCAGRLLGDFAFLLYDDDRRRLFCARDCFGVRPLYHARQGDTLLFASEPKALLAAAPALGRRNEAAIANYLVGQPPDGQTSFYLGIETLPAAHWMLVEPGRTELRRYWRLEPKGAAPGGDHPEQFRALFTEAVRCRLDGGEAVGAMLSGGLDSSSIACVAAPIHGEARGGALPTFSLVFDRTPAWNERPFIEAVLARGGMSPHFIQGGDHAPFDDFQHILREQDGPFLAPILSISRQVGVRAASEGVGVLLDGHGGDEVVSHGRGRLNELARDGRWLPLWREVRAVSDTYHTSALAMFAHHVREHRPAPRVARLIRRAGRFRRRSGAGGVPAWRRFVDPDLVARTDLPARMREAAALRADPLSAEAEQHLAVLGDPLQGYAFTVLDRNAAAAGIEPRYPFWDRRLVEFCVSVPAEQKLAGGWSRLVLRRAMEGVLPPVIQWRRDKLDFSPHLVTAMVDRDRGLIDSVLHDGRGDVAGFASLLELRAAFGRMIQLRDKASGGDVQAVWRAVTLALWLETLQG